MIARGLVVFALAFGLACSHLPGRTRVPLWEQPAPAPKEAPVVDAARLHRTTLANGAEVIVLEDRRLPAFSLGVVLRRGAGIETREEAGVAAFTAELMERGAGDRTALELAGVVDALGAELSVGASWDAMDAGVSGLSRDFDTLWDVWEDVILRPRFDADEAERVRSETLASLTQAADDPRTLVGWKFVETLYPTHRYGLPSGGTPTSVAALDGDAARAFYERVAVPDNAIFYAAGDVDPAALIARLEQSFAGWQGPPAPAPGAPPPLPPKRRVVIVDRPELGQAQITVGHEGIARANPERLPVQLMNTVLGNGGFSARLMGRIRAVEGLTYGIYSQFDKRREPGPFRVWTFTRVPEVGRLLTSLFEELERIRTQPPDPEELANAKNLRIGRFALSLEDSGAVLGSLVEIDLYGLPRDTLDTYRQRVRALTTEQTAAAALEFIHPERASIVVVGPAEELRPQLEAWGEVEVVAPTPPGVE